jgi:hypothetical protein
MVSLQRSTRSVFHGLTDRYLNTVAITGKLEGPIQMGDIDRSSIDDNDFR